RRLCGPGVSFREAGELLVAANQHRRSIVTGCVNSTVRDVRIPKTAGTTETDADPTSSIISSTYAFRLGEYCYVKGTSRGGPGQTRQAKPRRAQTVTTSDTITLSVRPYEVRSRGGR